MSDSKELEEILKRFDRAKHELSIFMDSVVAFISKHPELSLPDRHIVHSYRSRLKDRDHLAQKIIRKTAAGRIITLENIFTKVTDLAGVRILHLFQHDFRLIDHVVREKVKGGDWVFSERPKAYSWDPETVAFFQTFDLDVVPKPTSYTSVHYLIRPRHDSPICCELQVRTLFEEIWGEVDHHLNYPTECEDIACREQLKVLSKIVGAGSRLLDSLNRSQIARNDDSDKSSRD